MGESIPTLESDEQVLHTLARRLLSAPYPGGSAEEVQILVGELPADLPIEVPLPEGARTIGSLVRGDRSVQTVLDVDQSADAVLAFYREQLETAGWYELDWPMQPGGFGFGAEVGTATFCHSRRGPSLMVTAFEAEAAPTDVRLNLQTDPRQSPCAMLERPYGLAMSLIPNLRAPAGATMHRRGRSGGNGNSWHSTVILETDLDTAVLAAHYNEQLQAAGWKLTDHGSAGPAVWSTWSFTDDQGDTWAGILLTLDTTGGTGQRFAYLYIFLQVG